MSEEKTETKKTPLERFSEQLNKYLDQVILDRPPENDKEFIYTLEFLIFIVIDDAVTSQISEHDKYFGIISYDEDIDEERIMNELDGGQLEKLDELIKSACEKFDLTYDDLEQEQKTSFVDWYNDTAKKYDLKTKIDKKLFEAIKSAAAKSEAIGG